MRTTNCLIGSPPPGHSSHCCLKCLPERKMWSCLPPRYPTLLRKPQPPLQVPFSPVITHPGLQPGGPSHLAQTEPYLFRTLHLSPPCLCSHDTRLLVLRGGLHGSFSAKPSLCPQRPAVGITGPTPSSSGSCPAQQTHPWAVIYLFTSLTPPLDYEFLKGRGLSYPFIFISLVPSTG